MDKRLAVMDFETDPFKFGRHPRPFCCGFYDGLLYREFWGDDVVTQLMEFLREYDEPLIIYAHNGGKFDFGFLLEYFEGQLQIVNGAILRAYAGIHEFRDSLKIIPVPLGAYKKDEIDYRIFERNQREKPKNKREILAYQKSDCIYLYELVEGFWKEFGDNLTVGGTSMKQLMSFHTFARAGSAFDQSYRRFYYGGRVQCFEAGIIECKGEIVDVNSMYPDAMLRMNHPVTLQYQLDNRIRPDTFFVVVEGWNRGAFPIRITDGPLMDRGLHFDRDYGTFFITIHEFNAALQTDTFKIKRIIATHSFKEYMTFDSFINHFYESRLEAAARGDEMHKMFYKFILNSAYGKFAQNPDEYKDWCITHGEHPGEGWELSIINDLNDTMIWERPARGVGAYYNVAIAASITGAARAKLLVGLSQCVRPLYCDTDSIICESFHGDVDNKRLGAWKREETFDQIAIAGKKLYAVMRDGKPVKQANKGARMTAQQIYDVARGGEFLYENEAPTFRIGKDPIYIKRRIRATA